MTDNRYKRAGDGSVLRMAMAAVMLIVAGLGLMAWDDRPDVRGAQSLSVPQQP